MTVKSKELTEPGLIDLAGVKVYIAGPMSGLAMLNRPAFFAADPAVLPDGWDHDAYMRITIPMMMECDAVAFLPGWQQSKGSRQAFTRARAFGLDLLQLDMEVVADEPWVRRHLPLVV